METEGIVGRLSGRNMSSTFTDAELKAGLIEREHVRESSFVMRIEGH